MEDVDQDIFDSIGDTYNDDTRGDTRDGGNEDDELSMAVAETFGESIEDNGMEMDDELLRLVEDYPSNSALPSGSVSRPESPSTVDHSHASTPDPESMQPPAPVDASGPRKKVAASTAGAKKVSAS
jgi:hypothetical protein